MGDLYKELPWETEMAIVDLPGSVLEAAVRFSRSKEGEKPGFLHFDSGTLIDEQHNVVSINGEALQLNKVYKVAVLVHLLNGMDNVQPLADHVRVSGMMVPSDEACKPAKVAILTLIFKTAWRNIYKMLQLPLRTKDQTLEAWRFQIKEQLRKEGMLEKDCNISMERLRTELRKDFELEEQISGMTGLADREMPFVDAMLKALDANGDGEISIEELEILAS